MSDDECLDIARRVASAIDTSRCDMVLVTGSASRGIADRSSDVDVYLYLADGADATRSMQPSLAASGAVLLFGVPTATGRFEKFRLGGRYVDVEQVGCGVLDAIAGRVAMGGVDPNDIKTIIGVRDAIALHGASTLRTWQERTLLTDQVANFGGRSVGRPNPVATRALYDLTWARADELSYVARVAPVLLAGLGLLGAVNRQWVSIDDPKWMPWQVDRLAVKPPALMDGFRTALTVPTEESTDVADGLLDEILDLVDEHVEGADTRPARFALHLRTTPDSSNEHS